MHQWLSRPAFTVRLEPGERAALCRGQGGCGGGGKVDMPSEKTVRPIPPIAATPPLDFPTVEHATLSNGMVVNYAQRAAVPMTQMALSFDAGYAAERPASAACRA